jgi:hypothetical protein
VFGLAYTAHTLVFISSINCNRKLNSVNTLPLKKIFPDCREVTLGNKSRAREFPGNERRKLHSYCLSQLIS